MRHAAARVMRSSRRVTIRELEIEVCGNHSQGREISNVGATAKSAQGQLTVSSLA